MYGVQQKINTKTITTVIFKVLALALFNTPAPDLRNPSPPDCEFEFSERKRIKCRSNRLNFSQACYFCHYKLKKLFVKAENLFDD